MELYKKHRPKMFKDVIGQPQAVKPLVVMIKKKKLPHSILFDGPSGCGKTTIARILARYVNCGKHDFHEKNCADFRGIDMVRGIRSRMGQTPLSGKSMVYLIDEAHRLTGDAQDMFLKMLEDTPSHVYFFICTTEPQKLVKTIRNRCTEITVKSLSKNDLMRILKETVKKEQKLIPNKVLERISENCDSSARRAMVLLHQVIDIKDEKEQLDIIQSASVETQAFQIARALHNPRTKWVDMANILKQVDTSDAEGIRWMVMSYAKKVILGGGNNSPQAFLVLDAFRDNFYDCKDYGLVAACYEVVCGD